MVDLEIASLMEHGYWVVMSVYRPRLGNSLHYVVLVGVVYLAVGSFEGIRRVITVIIITFTPLVA